MEKSDTIPLKAQSPGHGLSRKRIICMAIVFAAGMLRILNFIKKIFGFSIFLAYIGWGLLLSLQPPFYPSEAEKKGATPSQYGFVFGIANLAAFLFAPFFGRYGSKIGPKILYNFGAFTQGFVGITFGFLVYIENAGAFLGLSYLLRLVSRKKFRKFFHDFFRFLDGVADAAAWGAGVSILMKLFPNKVSTIMSWTEMLFGLGYMLGKIIENFFLRCQNSEISELFLGPALGSALYQAGGFLLPFLVVGIWCLIGAFGILFTIPNVKSNDDQKDSNDDRKKLTLKDLAKVSYNSKSKLRKKQ